MAPRIRGMWTTSTPMPTIMGAARGSRASARVPDLVENGPLAGRGVGDRHPLPVPPAPGLDLHGHARDPLRERFDPHRRALHDGREPDLALAGASLAPARLDHPIF